jgi:hypothetical protein
MISQSWSAWKIAEWIAVIVSGCKVGLVFFHENKYLFIHTNSPSLEALKLKLEFPKIQH